MDSPTSKHLLPPDYSRFLEKLKERVRSARMRATLGVNRELILLYWDLGRQVVVKQMQARWGAAIIERLAHDLKSEFPGMTGFSPRNIWRMRAFYLAWRPRSRRSPPHSVESAILTRPVSELSWSHNIVLLQKIKDRSERLWYAQQAFDQGWSREVLIRQIASGLHRRQGVVELKADHSSRNM